MTRRASQLSATHLVLWFATALLLHGCAARRQLRQAMCPAPCTAQDIQFSYLGTGCLLISYNGHSILTDPFISNPGIGKMIGGIPATDTAYVNRYVSQGSLRDVRLVLSSHSHYDHLLDLPYLSSLLPPEAVLCANRTGKHIMAGYGLYGIVVLDSIAGDCHRPGQWVYSVDSTVRVMALRSHHPPQFAGLNIWSGQHTSDLADIPTSFSQWKQGRTHAFIADFMYNGMPDRRIYFSSSMASAPLGLVPSGLLEDKAVDIAFLGAAGQRDKGLYPVPVAVNVCPAQAVIIHWEDFFAKKKNGKGAKALSAKKTLQVKREVEMALPVGIPVRVALPMGMGY